VRKIKQETEACLSGLAASGRSVTADFLFPPDYIGFQGHFPGKPILPGACQVQCVLSTIEKGRGQRAVLKVIERAKYVTPIFPDEPVTCTVQEDADAGDVTFKARISKGGTRVTEMKLRVSLDEGESR
jgi:3-hydroxyacyl-[acyl-carrier-protein] dehydratase